ESAGGSEPFQTGILLEDHFYANTNEISDAAGTIITAEVAQAVEDIGKPEANFTCRVQDREYRVFYHLLNQDSAFPPTYQVCLYSMEEARREQRELRWKILASSGAGLVAAFLLSFMLAHGLSIPVRELVAGTEEIQRGNFGIQVPVRGRGEIGQL